LQYEPEIGGIVVVVAGAKVAGAVVGGRIVVAGASVDSAVHVALATLNDPEEPQVRVKDPAVKV